MFPVAELENAAAIARSAVAIFFLVAGAVKLARPKATAAALGVLLVPDRYRTPVTVLLAAGEIIVGIAVLLVPGRAALIPPGIMLAGFTVFLGYLTSLRDAPACGCLGDLGSASASLGLIRNVCLLALLALATGSAAAPAPGAVLGGLQIVLLLVLTTERIHMIGKLHPEGGISWLS